MNPKQFNKLFQEVAVFKHPKYSSENAPEPKVVVLPRPCEDCDQIVTDRRVDIYLNRGINGLWIKRCSACKQKTSVEHPLDTGFAK
jgi:hypothetical protein